MTTAGSRDDPAGRVPAFSGTRGVPARASDYLKRFEGELQGAARLGPVLDVACGDGRNGLYLASLGAQALLVDIKDEAVASLGESGNPGNVRFLRMDLEGEGPLPFEPESFGVVLVFRYLHRPLIPVLRSCLVPGGMLAYETFLEGQEVYDKPRNPAHLLARGELSAWFGDWEILDHFEGWLDDPPRYMGRIVCRKPRPVATPSGS